jgi:hypothetical protein
MQCNQSRAKVLARHRSRPVVASSTKLVGYGLQAGMILTPCAPPITLTRAVPVKRRTWGNLRNAFAISSSVGAPVVAALRG